MENSNWIQQKQGSQNSRIIIRTKILKIPSEDLGIQILNELEVFGPKQNLDKL